MRAERRDAMTASQRYQARKRGEDVPKRKPGIPAKNPWDWIEVREPGECWLWVGPLNAWGYGVFTKDKRKVRAHRAAWESINGAIPPGLILLHACDVRNCCNPAHLSVGTHQDNRADTVRKGRQARGSTMAAAKFDECAARSIRERHKGGEAQTSIAKDYGVHRRAIHNIVTGKTWRHA